MNPDTLEKLPADPIVERRELVQRVAAQSLRRRTLTSKAMVAGCGLMLMIALIPLIAVLAALISKGAHWWSVAFFTTSPQSPSISDLSAIGGFANAIVGSLVIDGIAAIFAVPVGIIAGLLLAESNSRFANVLRSVAETMTGLPSILLGIFIFQVLVAGVTVKGITVIPSIGVSGLAGSVALAILMIPIIMKASETSLRSVPTPLREAGLALGARRGVVARRIVLPTAAPGLITAVLLAFSRAVGETAPILFVIGGSADQPLTWNPFHAMSAMPLSIYENAINSPNPYQAQSAWGIGLFLVTLVLVVNLASRLVAAWIHRERR